MARALPQYRTFWQRFWAGFIDALVLTPLALTTDWAFANLSTPFFCAYWVGMSFLYFGYAVLLHGHFGQTIGKRVTRVRVLDVSGSKLTLRQALTRESPSVPPILYLLWIDMPYLLQGQNPGSPEVLQEQGIFYLAAQVFSFLWFVLEVATMLTNKRRRAIHDFIASSVVVRDQVARSTPAV